MELNSKHIEIANILIDIINGDQKIYYGDLENKVKLNMRQLWTYLGQLSVFCFNNDMPLISVIVVNSKTDIPGEGFYKEIYYPHKRIKANNYDKKLEIYIEELNLVLNYCKWDKLVELLDNEVFPNRGKFVPLNRLRRPFKRRNIRKHSFLTSSNTEDNLHKEIYKEGNIKLETHINKERNSKLIPKAKEEFKRKYGILFCELCEFNFEDFYGELGKNFIEGHHTKLISEMEEGHVSQIDDIMMLCPNCHSMVHRGIKRCIDICEIKEIIKIKK